MAGIEFNVDNENSLTADGNMTSVMNLLKPADVSGCIRLMVSGFKHIENLYKKALSNDGRIIGTERTDIINSIDDFFNTAILLWVLVNNKEGSQYIILIGTPKMPSMINITVNSEQWTAAGKVGVELCRPAENFSRVLNDKLVPDISKFLNTYKNAAEDGILDETERENLKNDLNFLLYSAIYLRFQTSYCKIDG